MVKSTPTVKLILEARVAQIVRFGSLLLPPKGLHVRCAPLDFKFHLLMVLR